MHVVDLPLAVDELEHGAVFDVVVVGCALVLELLMCRIYGAYSILRGKW